MRPPGYAKCYAGRVWRPILAACAKPAWAGRRRFVGACTTAKLGAMNVCQSCGACCATLRVSFPADEVDDRPGGCVPRGMTEPYGNVFTMRTTAEGCCVALRGTVGGGGAGVTCAIYDLRPSTCREFAPLAALGWGDEACDEVRRRRGLRPLTAMAMDRPQ